MRHVGLIDIRRDTYFSLFKGDFCHQNLVTRLVVARFAVCVRVGRRVRGGTRSAAEDGRTHEGARQIAYPFHLIVSAVFATGRGFAAVAWRGVAAGARGPGGRSGGPAEGPAGPGGETAPI